MFAKLNLKTILPHILAIIAFLFISFAFFPEVFEGKQLGGHDNANFTGMSKEIADYNKDNDDVALWTGSMFGGMPAYMIRVPFTGNKFIYLDRILQAGPRPVSFLFLYLIGFYILALALRINPWLAIAGAIAFAFSSYNLVLVAAGHNSKAIAIAYMAPILAGIFVTFRGKRILGAALMAIALSLQIRVNHPQITYYTLLMVFIYGASQLYFAIRDKQVKGFLISVGFLVIAAGLGAASNTDRLWTTMEYGKYTMRSPSELSTDEDDKTSGLTKSYATGWSYGIDETMSLLIPGFKGGASNAPLTERSEVYELIARNNPAQAKDAIKHMPLYWGEQASTMGNVYIGAIVIFLFVMGMFLADPRIKWWLLAASVLGILLSWGHNLMWFTELFMDHVPGYNKFRTVSMTLVIPALAMPILAMVVLNQILSGEVQKEKLYKALKWSVGIAGGVSLLFALFPDLAGNFISARDSNYQPALAEALQGDRRSLLRTDAFRSLVLILLSAGVILLFEQKKLKVNLAIGLMAALFVFDMWPVDKRYMNSDHFSPKREATVPFKASPADQFIIQQGGENQRVMNLSVATFQDASTSYFHPSIGGYHGAKLRRFQDIWETGLQNDIGTLYGALQSRDYAVVDSALASTNFLNLLNTRYFILSPENSPIINSHAAGNAWFVNQIQVVENADADIQAVAGIDLLSTCTLDKRYAGDVEKKIFTADASAAIILDQYSPNRMVYKSQSATELFAVFSEIYYPAGWHASIDGEEVAHHRVNYLLRGMPVPAGSHEIVFEFRPQSYYRGSMISGFSSILLLLLALGSIFVEYRKKA